MIVETSMHPKYLSNTYLVADAPGGHGVFIDAGGPIDPLLARASELDVTITNILLTHEHHDHTLQLVPLEERFGANIVTPELIADGEVLTSGALTWRALMTPGHCESHCAWLALSGDAPQALFTGDVLFRSSVGGTMNGGPEGFAKLRHSIIDVILTFDDELLLFPGHTDPTTVGDERQSNPFVRAWVGDAPLHQESVSALGMPATLLLEGPDYDGGTKAWVRFEDGHEAILGGSMITR